MMVEHLGAGMGDTLKEVNDTKGGHARFSYLKRIFKKRLLKAQEAYNVGDRVEMQQMLTKVILIYLLYLVGITLFTDKSFHYMDVAYLKYYRYLELDSDFTRGSAALSHLYKELNNASHYKTRHVSRYFFFVAGINK